MWTKVHHSGENRNQSQNLTPEIFLFLNFGPNILPFLESLREGYKTPKFYGPIFKNKKLLGDQILNFSLNFPENGEN